ncbi:MAG: GNAT family N-acetyltransferase [Pseudomonadota bacterium]
MIPELALRPLRPDDGAALADLHRRAILAVAPRFYSRAELVSWAYGIDPEAYAKIAATTERFVIAELADEVITGFCSWRMVDAVSGRICGLYVDPRHQGTGAGKGMLKAGEDTMIDDGARQIVIEASLAAVPFYVSQGYFAEHRELSETRGGRKIPVRWMRKVLTP